MVRSGSRVNTHYFSVENPDWFGSICSNEAEAQALVLPSTHGDHSTGRGTVSSATADANLGPWKLTCKSMVGIFSIVILFIATGYFGHSTE